MSRKHPVDRAARERLRRQSKQRTESTPRPVPTSRREAATACGWCGGPIDVKPVGRIPKWCKPACRQRAREQKRAAESGRSAVTIVERFVAAPAAAGGRQRAQDWPTVLKELATELDRGHIYRRDLPALAQALDHVLDAFRRTTR